MSAGGLIKAHYDSDRRGLLPAADRRDLGMDPRFWDTVEDWPRPLLPVYARPWIEDRMVFEAGYPVEYRVFIEDSRGHRRVVVLHPTAADGPDERAGSRSGGGGRREADRGGRTGRPVRLADRVRREAERPGERNSADVRERGGGRGTHGAGSAEDPSDDGLRPDGGRGTAVPGGRTPRSTPERTRAASAAGSPKESRSNRPRHR